MNVYGEQSYSGGTAARLPIFRACVQRSAVLEELVCIFTIRRRVISILNHGDHRKGWLVFVLIAPISILY